MRGSVQVNQGAPLAPDELGTKPSRRSGVVAAGVLAATGILLGIAYFPMLFNTWQTYDDEGVFVVSLRELLHHHGSLYTTIWSDKYGPFYYLVMSTVYRVIHQDPTLANGRWIVLIVTAASASLFGAAVWRVTKNLPCGVLCQVGTFVILIESAGNEPMHPGSLSVLLIGVVAYEASSYAVKRGRAQLIGLGAATGALLMTKLNTGGLVAIAIVTVFVVGSSSMPRIARIAVAGLAALAPVILMLQNASASWVAVLAFLVSGSILGMCVLMSVDLLRLPTPSLLWVAAGAAVVCVGSLAFPLFSGTSLSAVLTGVFVKPLDQAGQLTVPANVSIDWFYLLLTVGGIYVAVAVRSLPIESVRAKANWAYGALAVAGFWVLGLGVTFGARGGLAAPWLPALVLLPAIAFVGDSPESTRLALRCLVLLAALQILVAYPVAGSQVAWGTAAMVAPCAVAIAVGIDHFSLWHNAGRFGKGIAAGFACLAVILASSVWPPGVWKTYLNYPKLNLAGTSLMRIDPDLTLELQQLVQAIHLQCDTFYGVPDENSLYVFSGMPAFTGMLADRPNGLSVSQQEQVVNALQQKTAAGERVCVVRDASQGNELVAGPLNDALDQYQNVVETVGNYTIARHS
jgi:hypothetical protein